MRLFAEVELRSTLETQIETVRKEVRTESRNKLLNINEAEYIEYLKQRHSLEPLEFHWNDVSVSDREEMITAERFSHSHHVIHGKRYPKQIVTYHIPFTGERDLLKCAPSTKQLWSMEVDVTHNFISFEVVNRRNDVDEIKREADINVSRIRQQFGYLAKEVEAFIARFEAEITSIVRDRKQELMKQTGLLEQLGVPFKRSKCVPSTFAVPTAIKSIAVKPSAPGSAFKPEPTLDVVIYREIMKICHHTGVEMEKHPSIYQGKDEETLRDHFIMVLSPHFDSVPGETFNRSGKTDILIRHEMSNVFVAECKFWNGPKGFHKTIDQILGYLTWRDSKAAILSFARTKELNTALMKIETAASQHSCFVKTRNSQGDGSYIFDFHLRDDSSRGVQFAVMCFHFPRQNK